MKECPHKSNHNVETESNFISARHHSLSAAYPILLTFPSSLPPRQTDRQTCVLHDICNCRPHFTIILTHDIPWSNTFWHKFQNYLLLFHKCKYTVRIGCKDNGFVQRKLSLRAGWPYICGWWWLGPAKNWPYNRTLVNLTSGLHCVVKYMLLKVGG